jgi:DNA repair ATPase RecN
LTLFLQIGAALGGLTFFGGIITALAIWRKSKAEARKAGADAVSVLTDTALKAASTAIAKVEQQAEKLGHQLERTQGELEKTRDELQAVRRHMGVLEGLLRQQGVPVPELVWPPMRNGVS